MENKKRTFRRIAAASAAICLSLNIAFAEELGTNKLGFGSSISVSAADSTISIGTATVTYTPDIASNSITITKVIPGSETSIEIPETIHRANVTAIGEEAFIGCTALKSVTIPDSVNSIEKSAFESCTALEEVNFGSSSKLTLIGEEAFMGCTSLKRVTIPDSVDSIEKSAFESCTALESVTIPDSVDSIEKSTFESCTALKDVNFGSSSKITSIGEEAFMGCSLLKSITLPDSVDTIGIYAFDDCTKLTSVKLPENDALIIGAGAFSGCESLKSIDIPESVMTIEKALFRNCASLEEVNFSSSSDLISIGEEAFMSCTALESVTIPDSVDSIEKNAFESCIALEEVNFGSGSRLASIGEYAFMNCPSLESIDIPRGVMTIENLSFLNCISLQEVNFSSSSGLISIGTGAFSGCTALESIALPDSVETIGMNAFDRCEVLASVKLPVNDSLTIEASAFSNCKSLESIAIPNGVTNIGIDAFKNCDKLKKVFCKAGLDLTNSGIPDAAAKTRYEISNNFMYITEVIPDSGNTPVVIPDTVCGYEVQSVAKGYRQYVSETGHTHKVSTATCTEGAECLICGKDYGSTDPDNHDVNTSVWEYDEQEHWNLCRRTGCGAHLNTAAHTYDNGVITTAPTETAEGIKTYTCTVCGYEKTEAVPKADHSPAASWKYDSENHWKPCTECGEKLDTAPHTYDNGVITTAPTETAEGIKTYTCTVCGYEKNEAVPKSDHSPAANWKYDSENHWKLCTECGEKLETAAHTYDNGVITTAPTETSEGIKTYTCTVCGYEKTESIEKLPKAVFPITSSGDVTADKPYASTGETVTVSAPFGYDIIVTDASGKTIAKISEKGSFEMPASSVTVTAVRGEIFTHMSNAWSHSYVYSYDSDMNRLKVNSDSKRGIVTIDLGTDCAGRSFTLYSGRKSTSKKIISGVLDENGKYTFNADEGRNYTLVIE